MPPRDITRDFIAAASALPLGELVQDDFFTLAESVGALEIMDPKMDSGFLETGESLDPEYDVGTPLSPEQVIGVIDELLCYEAAWYQGNPLAQTVFACIYVDNLLWPAPKSLDDAVFKPKIPQIENNELVDGVLRAYCCGLVKSCDFVHAQITREQYYEDEDFSAHLYNRWLLSSVDVQEVIDLLNQASSQVSNAADVDEALRSALIHRLGFRSYLLETISQKPTAQPETFCGLFQQCLHSLEEFKASTKLGEAVPDAFSTKIQRRLVSSTPPRPIVKVSFDEAIEEFTGICRNAQDATEILKCTSPGNTINFIRLYMSQDPQPNVYVRCLMQTLVHDDGAFLGRIAPKSFIYSDLLEMILGDSILVDPVNDNAEAPQSPQFLVAQNMNRFTTSASHYYTDLARCLCMNRSRTRRLMGHTLNDWENLQFEAEEIDSLLQPHTGEVPLIDRTSLSQERLWSFPLSSWTYNYKLRQMEWIVQLGFELSIYLPDEMSKMFWYLRFVADIRAQHLSRISTFARRAYDLLHTPSEAQIAGFEKTFAVLEYAMGEAGATATFAECLCHIYQALTLLDLLPVPPRPYSDLNLRHSLRLKPFLCISLPPPMPIDRLEKAIADSVKDRQHGPGRLHSERERKANKLFEARNHLDKADDLARMARKEWDALTKHDPAAAQMTGCEKAWRQKNKDTVKSVIAAGIAIMSMIKAANKAQHDGVDHIKSVEVQIPERGYHEWWPVPTIKSK